MRALPDLQARQLVLFDTDTITIFKEGKPELALWHLKECAATFKSLRCGSLRW